MCYSHQTGPVKSQHVVLLLKHPRESEHQADSACISSSVSSFSSPLPGTPAPPPAFPSSWTHTSHTVSESPRLSTHSVILLSTQNRWVCRLARRCLSVIYPVCVESASLSAPRVTTHESRESANHVGPDVPPQFSQRVKPPHSSPADGRCLCLAALQKASLNQLQT